MRRSKLITGAVTGAVLIAVTLFFAARMESIASTADDAVFRATGARLSYSGLPGITFWPFWPETAVTLDDIALASAQGGTPLVTAAQMQLQLSQSLFGFGQPAIASITLIGPRINMSIGRDGKAGWVFGDETSQESGTKTPVPLHIVNGRLAFHDERSGFALAIDKIEAATALQGTDGEFTAKGAVVWNKQPVSFTLFLKSPRRLAKDGSPIDLNFSSPSLTLALSGRLATAATFNLSGQATVKSGDVRQLAQWLGNPLAGSRGLQNLAIAGNFEASEKAITFHQAKLSIDDMRGQGDIGLTRAGGRVHLDASLGMDHIDLNPYRAADDHVVVLTLLEQSWSIDTVAFSALKNLDARLRLATNEIIYGDLKTGPAQVAAKLAGGVLDLKLDQITLYGGAASAQIRLDGSQRVPALAVSFTGSNLDGEQALRGALSLGKIAGKMSTTFAASASGSSVAEMVSRLKGSGSFRISDGSVTDMDLATMIHKASETVQDAWPVDPSLATPFDALSAAYTIEDGIVATQNMVLTSPQLAITLRGEIDLARQAFDLASDPRLASDKKAAGKPSEFATFPVPVIVKGPWIAPRIYPDMPGILDDPDTAFRALKKLGLGTATVESSTVPPAN